MTRLRLRTLWRAFVPSTPRTHDLRYDRDVGESGLSPVSSARSQPARIEDCDVRRGRTSPPDHCDRTPVTWRKTQSSNTKYVPDTERSPTPDTSPPAEDAHPSNGPSNRPDTPRTHHRARGLHPQGQSSAPRVRPRGSAGQDHLTRTRASVRPATPAHVRPFAYAPGEVPAPTHQAASLPVPRSPRASSPAPLRFPASLKERRADIGQHPQAH